MTTPEVLNLNLTAATRVMISYNANVVKLGCTGTPESGVLIDGTLSGVVVNSLGNGFSGPQPIRIIANLSAGSHTIRAQHLVDACTATWSSRVLSASNANTLIASSANGTTDYLNSTTYTDLATYDRVSFTLSQSTPVIVSLIANTSRSPSSVGTTAAAFNIDGSMYGGTQANASEPAYFVGVLADRFPITLAAGAHTIDIEYLIDNNDAYVGNRTLTVELASSYLASTSISTAQATTSTSYVDLATPDQVTFTSPSASNFLVDYWSTTNFSSYADNNEIALDGALDAAMTYSNYFYGHYSNFSSAADQIAADSGSHSISVQHLNTSASSGSWFYRVLTVTPSP